MSPRRSFLDHPEAWTRASRRTSDRADWAGIERDPRLSGNQWLDWVLVVLLALCVLLVIGEAMP